MKVIHVVRQFSPSVGGLEDAVLKLCKASVERGLGVSVVTLDRIARGAAETLPGIDQVDGIPVRRIPSSGSSRYPLAPRVLQHLQDADLVHVHAIDFFFDFLALTRPWHGKPLVASTHGGFFHTSFAQTLKRAYFRTATRTSARAYRAIFASSQSDLELFGTITPSNLSLVENGVDVRKWAGLAAPTPNRTLLYIGRFSSNKQIEKLFSVLEGLRALHPEWRLIVAGRPWDVTTDELRSRATEHGLLNAIDVIDSPSDEAIGNAIGAARYIVSGSRHEGFGISIVEGMSAGLVPVLNRIPPFETLVREAGCGCLFDVDNAAQAAAEIERLHLETTEDGSRLRDACMSAAARYSWAAAADRYIERYAAAL